MYRLIVDNKTLHYTTDNLAIAHKQNFVKHLALKN